MSGGHCTIKIKPFWNDDIVLSTRCSYDRLPEAMRGLLSIGHRHRHRDAASVHGRTWAGEPWPFGTPRPGDPPSKPGYDDRPQPGVNGQ